MQRLRIVLDNHVSHVPGVKVGKGRRRSVPNQHIQQRSTGFRTFQSTNFHVGESDIQQWSTVNHLMVQDGMLRIGKGRQIFSRTLGKIGYAMLCYAMLCYAMLCYAMLCYAMLCYAMLCYAMLCYAIPDRSGPVRSGPDRTGPDRTGPDRTGPDRTGETSKRVRGSRGMIPTSRQYVIARSNYRKRGGGGREEDRLKASTLTIYDLACGAFRGALEQNSVLETLYSHESLDDTNVASWRKTLPLIGGNESIKKSLTISINGHASMDMRWTFTSPLFVSIRLPCGEGYTTLECLDIKSGGINPNAYFTARQDELLSRSPRRRCLCA
jgi:hypothetical protein